MASERKVLLRSSDEQEFLVEEAVTNMSEIIKTMLEEVTMEKGKRRKKKKKKKKKKTKKKRAKKKGKIEDAKGKKDNQKGHVILPILSNVNGNTLKKIVDYCKKHTDQEISKEELKKFDEEFSEVGTDDIYDLIMASKFLNIKVLFDFLCHKFADMIIRFRTLEEMREKLNIKKDFNQEEEAEIKKENSWAFE